MVATKSYGSPMVIAVEDFAFPGCTQVKLEVANGGSGEFRFTVAPKDGTMPEWLEVTPMEATVTEQAEVTLRCNQSRLPAQAERCALLISDGDATVAVAVTGKAGAPLPAMTFAPRKGVISMLAEHCAEKKDAPGGAFQRIGDYGKYGSGMKVFPTTAEFSMEAEKPSLTYSFQIDQPGAYRVELLTAPQQPGCPGRKREPAGGNRNPGAEGAAHRPGFPGGREQRPPLVRRRAGPDSHRRNPISV